MAQSQIKKCICDHDFQDQKYGPGMRVMAPTGKGENSGTYKCTVCGRTQSGEKQKDKPKEKK